MSNPQLGQSGSLRAHLVLESTGSPGSSCIGQDYFFLEEWEGDDDSLYQEVCGGTYPVPKDGAVSLPTGPGLGLTVNFAELTRRFPFKGMNRRATLTK